MKTPHPTPDRENTRNAIVQAVALALMALVLQGCATARTAWSRQDDPRRETTTFFKPDTTTREASPRTVLVSWTF